MKKVEKPKKPLFFYYLIVLAVTVLLNLFVFPMLLISSTVHRLLFCHAPNSSQILPRQICFQTA